jgi:hypothetical protein
MDNFHIDITSKGPLAAAMAIAFGNGPNMRAVGYRLSLEKGLIFYQYDSSKRMTPLPFKLDAAGAADFATRWLAEADYGPEPDHDGHNSKGWRLYCEDWGHVDGEYQAFVAVKPAWAMHGK